MRVAKTKMLISFAVTGKLICVFVFAYAKSRFSHDEAHLSTTYSPGLTISSLDIHSMSLSAVCPGKLSWELRFKT